jgi:uncharacterized RDD family membrane protein YckC
MTQGYGPQDPNQPGYGQPPPPPPAYGQPAAPAGPAYGQQPGPYGGDRPGFYMGRQLANWLQRVGAYLIDQLIVAIPFTIAGLLAGTLSNGSGSGAGVTLLAVVLYAVGLGLVIYNRFILQGRTGQSWGKQVLGLRLLRMSDGQPIGAGMAFVRDLCHIVDALPCYLGYLWPIWDNRRQTFADKIIGTVVIVDA